MVEISNAQSIDSEEEKEGNRNERKQGKTDRKVRKKTFLFLFLTPASQHRQNFLKVCKWMKAIVSSVWLALCYQL